MEFNYRKFYEEKTKIPLPPPKLFHIHHIDFNRTHNNIENLVALPSSLHLIYHSQIQEIKMFKLAEYEFEIYPTIIRKTDNKNISYKRNPLWRYNTEIYLALSDLNYTQNECSIWIDYRNHLLYNYPTHHNIINYTKES